MWRNLGGNENYGVPWSVKKKIVLRKHLKNILIRLNSKVLQLKDDSQDVFNHSFNLIILFCWETTFILPVNEI